jgi:hypothetical protein
MSNPNKCKNPACNCIPINGEDFCSIHCESTKETTEIMCECDHACCRGDATKNPVTRMIETMLPS